MRTALLLLVIATSAAQAREVVVIQKDKSFVTPTLTVQPGDTVVFRNEDPVPHNVYSSSPGNEFNLKVQAAGAASSVKLKTEGTVSVRCAFHPGMKLTVTVKK